MKNFILFFLSSLLLKCSVLSDIKITIENNSNDNLIITEVYIVKSEIKEWGDNILEKPIKNGESKIFILKNGSYNIKIVTNDGSYNEFLGISFDITITIGKKL